MSPIIILLLILAIIILSDNLFLSNITNLVEKFSGYQMFQQFIPFNTYKFPMFSQTYPLTNPNWFWNQLPVSNGYTDLPWNNMQLGTTHNMSYDIRGDPLVIPKTTISPWNNPEVYPIYNNPDGVLY